MPELFLGLAAQVFPHPDDLGIIQFSLFTGFSEAGIVDFFELLRQIPQDFGFGPAQDKGTDHSAQPFHALLIPVLDDGRLELIPERAVIIQKTGHDIVKNAPQLAQPVLNRRACQRESGLRSDELHAFGGFRPVVLDILGFIDELIPE